MSGYTCTKCGETASSKCVRQRSVFPNDQLATCLGNMVTLKAERRGATEEKWRREADSNIWKATVTIESGYVPADDEDEALKDVVEFMLGIAERAPETFRRAFCDHRWKITEGECMFGCCKA